MSVNLTLPKLGTGLGADGQRRCSHFLAAGMEFLWSLQRRLLEGSKVKGYGTGNAALSGTTLVAMFPL
jgi:hypothetical protein